jgi:centromeric protein E
VRDLLSEDTPSLRLLDDPHRGTVAEGAREARVRSAAELRALLAVLQPRRQVAHNGAHEASSRSHLLVRLLVESWPLPPAADAQREPQSDADSSDEECWLHRVVDAPAEDAAAAAPTPRSVGLLAALNFVDLAGSERTGSSSGATSAQGGGGSGSPAAPEGLRLKEGLHINRSLLTLGAVIRKLGEGAKGVRARAAGVVQSRRSVDAFCSALVLRRRTCPSGTAS